MSPSADSSGASATVNSSNNDGEKTIVSSKLTPIEADEAISRFQTFLRFETISATAPATGEYKKCAEFLKYELQSIKKNDKEKTPLLQDVHFLPEAPDHSPVVVAHWLGKDPTLPILLLNSHYDVVPADVEAWTVPPFGAIRSDDGKIYGRGTQDMKCVCMQYIEAIRQLASRTTTTTTTTTDSEEWIPERSIYLTFVPDEEVRKKCCFLLYSFFTLVRYFDLNDIMCFLSVSVS
jgi:aminoacylase